MTTSDELKALYKEMAALTRPKCGECRCPLSCCSPEYCDQTAEFALESWGVRLEDSGYENPKGLRFMGPDGCIVEPYLRPICTVHVCEIHYMTSPEFSDEYFMLRARLNALEMVRSSEEE